jgi:hypothetical protein
MRQKRSWRSDLKGAVRILKRPRHVSRCQLCGLTVRIDGAQGYLPNGWLWTRQGKFCQRCKQKARA